MATRGPISIPPFEDRADLQRFANSHLTNFDPPSIVLPIDFHRASSPSRSDIDLFFLQCQCFSINILQFYRANWSYGGEFFLYLKPGPTKTGSSSEIIVFPSHRKGSTIGLLPFRIEIFFKKFCELEGWSYRRGEEEGRRIVEGTMVFRFGAALETARLKLDNVWRHDCRKLVGEDCTHRLNSRGSRGL